MKVDEYFLIRPKDKLQSLIAQMNAVDSEFGEGSIVWCDEFDLRERTTCPRKDFMSALVKLAFLAYVASQLGTEFTKRFESLNCEVFDELWEIEWIPGGLVTANEVEGDLTEEVI